MNGGFGLQAADNTVGGEIAYGVVSGVSLIAYGTSFRSYCFNIRKLSGAVRYGPVVFPTWYTSRTYL